MGRSLTAFWRGPGAILALLVGVALAYANAIDAPFIWDDFELVVQNGLLRDPSALTAIFRTDPFGYPLELGQYYRPIQTLTFWAQYQLHGAEPAPFHLFNVVLHALDVLLAFALFLRLGLSRLPAWLAALAIALHPTAVECVTFIAVRGDLLLAFFTLVAIHALLGLPNAPASARGATPASARGAVPAALLSGGAVLLAVALALLTKESAIVLPFLLVSTAWWTTRSPAQRAFRRPRLAVSALAVGMALVYLVLRWNLQLGDGGPQLLSHIAYASPAERLLTAPRIFATYIRLLLVPVGLHVDYQFVERSAASVHVWLLGPLALATLVGLWLVARRVQRDLAGLFLAWFVLCLAPFFHVVPFAQTLAERWLYLPSFGFFPLLVLAGKSGAALLPRTAASWARWTAGAGVAIWFLFLLGQTHLRNRDWQSAAALFGGDLDLAADSFLVPHNYGIALLREGETSRAKELFQLAVERAPGPGYGTAHNSLGSVLEAEGDLEGARREFERSLRLSRYVLAYSNLGRVLIRLGRAAEAIPLLEDGLRSYPHHADLHYYLGFAHANLGAWAEAIEAWRGIPAGSPDYPDVPALIAEAERRAEAAAPEAGFESESETRTEAEAGSPKAP